MKLLFDQNLSYKLVKALEKYFPNSNHVFLLDLHKSNDIDVWKFAKKNGFIIVTQDSDFYENSILYWFPPKVIWIRTWNTSTKNIEEILKKNYKSIIELWVNDSLWCLAIY